VDLKLLASTFGVIFLAELPDKTIFATVLMASKRNPLAVFVGAAAAFVVQTAVAVAFGRALHLLPERWVHWGAGLMFLALAAASLRRDDESEGGGPSGRAPTFWAGAWAAFVVIFIAEWGDLTQLSTATLVARTGKPATIFCGAVLGLWAATAMAVAVGHQAKGRVSPVALKRIGAAAFAVVGVWMLVAS